MARKGRRAQSRRIGRAINWFKGGMVARSIVPALLAGVVVGWGTQKLGITNPLIKYGAAGIAGGIPAVASMTVAPMLLGSLGGVSQSGSASSPYYG